MKYTDLDGNPQKGEVWCPGPKTNTVWVLTPEGTAVVHATKKEEVDYKQPRYLEPLSPETVRKMHDYIAAINEDTQELKQQLGARVADDETYEAMYSALQYHEQAQRSRLPFINAHGGKAPISDKRLRELASEE